VGSKARLGAAPVPSSPSLLVFRSALEQIHSPSPVFNHLRPADARQEDIEQGTQQVSSDIGIEGPHDDEKLVVLQRIRSAQSSYLSSLLPLATEKWVNDAPNEQRAEENGRKVGEREMVLSAIV
jgi:hypothetical protein